MVTLLSLLVNSMAGYAFAKLRFRGRERLFRAVDWARAPDAGRDAAAVPVAEEARADQHLLGRDHPGPASIFGIFLVRQYAISIPDDLLDAARMDGASEVRIFCSIVLPASRRFWRRSRSGPSSRRGTTSCGRSSC